MVCEHRQKSALTKREFIYTIQINYYLKLRYQYLPWSHFSCHSLYSFIFELAGFTLYQVLIPSKMVIYKEEKVHDNIHLLGDEMYILTSFQFHFKSYFIFSTKKEHLLAGRVSFLSVKQFFNIYIVIPIHPHDMESGKLSVI